MTQIHDWIITKKVQTSNGLWRNSFNRDNKKNMFWSNMYYRKVNTSVFWLIELFSVGITKNLNMTVPVIEYIIKII